MIAVTYKITGRQVFATADERNMNYDVVRFETADDRGYKIGRS